jgi:hypothetical protein
MIDIVTEINATRRAVEAGRGRADQEPAVQPYLLLVTDTRTGEALFLARVADPV